MKSKNEIRLEKFIVSLMQYHKRMVDDHKLTSKEIYNKILKEVSGRLE